MKYLLDTNTISHALKFPAGPVGERILESEAGALCTSIMVVAELRFGYLKRGSERLRRDVEALLASLEIMPWESPAELKYAELRLALEAVGSPIGQMDMLIAAHALALDAVVVTAKEREFMRVPGLKVENWELEDD
ncbi:type II toxin-antitoxin system VapC family toxin [Martelella limonii]|uniref:type II toxin-antitoxin system VapC family toxin n=1 Tax=Martelella limonii TaxID=1647649 RepID=UPI0015800149|nr:type II toxin-antitoxin system VapC family toxin [Martelella limonii]